ncbi:hypothetical protein KAFR_0C03340 [Kazachstania africana CBS 2517]|uniref:SPX domain-containing protein n=1 Tax=Kazachstania africana (strain ATCC 22294 / BCRC 22015 / CBS 2517 / CECT 1963 / NBRC 1671 / NRRL Y-8276) TaxID=1071382 RepID=H2ASH6_KAZAF|nr:hypothetical protein KAFR_0C03340 [Kazachstania africana CBS 2517]CCF57326.1 hypothetical protein KAFR_0C03340 [Kazachstania africana CBS 2517]
MLFGVKLANDIYPPWKDSYISYDGLKKLLKEDNDDTTNQEWTERDESRFVEALDSDLEKVYTFQVDKYNNLMDKLTHLEKETSTEDKVRQLDPDTFQRILEDALSEAKELDNFSRLNYTGFMKIVKKHDKLHSQYPSVKSLLQVRLKELPFHSEEYSPVLYRISFLYTILRCNFSTISKSLASTSRLSNVGSISDSKTNYKIFKFWIHKDNLMEVKTRILRHLPVLVYASAPTENDDIIDRFENDVVDADGGIPSANSSSKNSEKDVPYNSYDPVITTVYFDNEFFELYNNKLLKQHSARTLRLRWTGKLADKPDIFLEKRILSENEGGIGYNFEEVRLKMKQKYINNFIFDGDKKYEELVLNRMRQGGTTDPTLKKVQGDFEVVQQFIMQEQLQPVLRTVYRRTAFQIPGDDRIRIVIDSDILSIREDSFDKTRPIRDPKSWHRRDIDTDVSNPLRFLRSGEYAKFPYSVMEIRIKQTDNIRPNEVERPNSYMNTTFSSNLPGKHGQWITELINSHLVKEVPKFSLYIQGVASLFGEDEKLDILPFWLPDLEKDIRRDPKQAYEEEKKKLKKQKEIEAKIAGMRRLSKIEPVENENEEESETRRPNSSILEVRELDLEERNRSKKAPRGKRKKTSKAQTTFLNVLSGKAPKLINFDSEDEEIELPAGVKKPTSYLKNAGPIKVEPKVWLANERTFNKWLRVTALLSALTFSIYNSIRHASFPRLATTMAYIYFCLTIFCGLWSYTTYLRRLDLIKARSGTHLDAPLGPILLALVLAATLIINFIIAFKEAAIRQHGGPQLSSITRFQEGVPEKLDAISDFIFKLVGAQ